MRIFVADTEITALKKVALIVLVLAAVHFASGCREIPAPSDETQGTQAPQSNVEMSRLPVLCPASGSKSPTSKAYQRPVAVMIENHPEARPQSGLGDACLVFEALAEGGITRFMALFYHREADTIGPVRSARDYYAELASGYNAIYAHVGGSPSAYGAIQSLGVDNLDEFANKLAYWRSKDRRAPHNLYTSTQNLYRRAREKGYAIDTAARPLFEFGEGAPEAERPQTATVEIDFSTPQFKVRYEYDPQENVYWRFHGNKAHIQKDSGNQIKTKNVIIMITSVVARDSLGRLQINTVGEGEAWIFRDGQRITGRWLRSSVGGKIYILDENDEDIPLNVGPSWVGLVDSPGKVTYTQATESADAQG